MDSSDPCSFILSLLPKFIVLTMHMIQQSTLPNGEYILRHEILGRFFTFLFISVTDMYVPGLHLAVSKRQEAYYPPLISMITF